ncbi:MAG: hypothetical protein R2863_07715 [Candidatus Kapaibacterium sp.]|nr:hypothetical protein [Ignavibacteriota bacterium]MCB9220542.1 hypothetical protein [Ignavibacteria bacterium]
MKKITVLLVAFAFTSVSTFAAVNVNYSAKKNVVEVQSDNSNILEVNFTRINGGSYETNFEPANNIKFNTNNMLPGIYKIEVVSLEEEKSVQFLNIN